MRNCWMAKIDQRAGSTLQTCNAWNNQRQPQKSSQYILFFNKNKENEILVKKTLLTEISDRRVKALSQLISGDLSPVLSLRSSLQGQKKEWRESKYLSPFGSCPRFLQTPGKMIKASTNSGLLVFSFSCLSSPSAY